MERMALATAADTTAPTISPDQLELITHTVAKEATADELRLYLYDCARQGVHPLDRLIHFTKRKGRYTPVTSIDLMRMRAAETGEYAGNDQADFTGTPRAAGFTATARVWRLVHGQRVPFSRTARWEEYCPPAGPSGEGDAMWRRMPHVMLAKCAEAQALRAGFPRQLHGLYAAEELDQADRAPAMNSYDTRVAPPPSLAAGAREARATVTDLDAHEQAALDNVSDADHLPDGVVRITRIDSTPTKNANVTKFFLTLSTGEQVTTINSFLASVAEDACEKRTPVRLETRASRWGLDVVKITAADAPEPHPEPVPPVEDQPF